MQNGADSPFQPNLLVRGGSALFSSPLRNPSTLSRKQDAELVACKVGRDAQFLSTNTKLLPLFSVVLRALSLAHATYLDTPVMRLVRQSAENARTFA